MTAMNFLREYCLVNISKLLPVLAIFLVGFGVFGIGTWNNGYIWDDLGFIFEWTTIQDLSWPNLVALVKGDLPLGQDGVYRPLRSLLYALSFAVWGTNFTGYHIQAAVIHGLTAVIVFLLIKRLIHNPKAALIGGLVFALHPIHTEAVAWTTASFDTIGFSLAIASVWLWTQSNFGQHWLWYSLGLVAGTIAIFSNEMALVLPGLWLITWLYAKNTAVQHKPILQMKQTITAMAPLLLVVLGYCGIRFGLLKIISREDTYLFGSLPKTMLVMSVGLVKYLQLLIWPWPLTINHVLLPGINGLHYHDYYRGNPILVPSLSNLVILGSIGLIVLVAMQSWKLRNKLPELLLGLVWIIGSLLPVMQFFPQSIIFAERFLYIPSVGFVLLVAGFWHRLEQKFRYSKLCSGGLWGVTIFILAFYTILTIRYSQTWKDGLTFWNYQATQSPPSALIYSDLGREYALREDYVKAQEWLEKAYAVNPRNVLAVSNLGAVYALLNKYELSLKLQEEALQIMPTYASAILNKAEAYYNLGDFAKASEHYQQYLVYFPKDIDTLIKLGKSFHSLFIYNQAEHFFQQAVAIDSNSMDAIVGLGNLYMDWGKLTLAKEQFTKVNDIYPNQPIFEEKLTQIEQLLLEHPEPIEIEY